VDAFENLQKRRTGLDRIVHAGAYSAAGLRAAWGESAFRTELLLAAILLPSSFVLGRTLPEVALLAASVVLVLIVELLNTALESAVDRVGLEWHALSKRAKDAGSAAVLLALLLCAAIWTGVAWSRYARQAPPPAPQAAQVTAPLHQVASTTIPKAMRYHANGVKLCVEM
jgi:diacylglycerol kinase (ATP)